MPGTFDFIAASTLLGVAAGGDERDVVLAQVFADQPAGVAGGAVDDDGFLAHVSSECRCVRRSHAHAAIDRQADAGDEARRVGQRNTAASACRRPRRAGRAGSARRRRRPPRSTSGARPTVDDVVGELHAHVGRDQAGVDAVDAHAVAELAGFHRGDPGHPVDRGFGAGIDRRCRERDRRRDRGDVDDRAALARRRRPGRIARNACFMPSAVPTMLTSHIRRTSSALMSMTSEVISMPALLIRMSKPPSVAIGGRDGAVSHCASSVTSSWTKPAVAPSLAIAAGGVLAEVVQDVADHHRGAGLRQRLRDRRADAARAAGDQGCCARQTLPLMRFLLPVLALCLSGLPPLAET